MQTAYKILLTVFFSPLALCFFSQPARAQDPAYTQAFLAPVFLNPAATGAGEYDLRISAIYRRQWWLIPSNFHSMAFSVDKFLSGLNSGIGLLATHSSTGYLARDGIYATYAYTICAGTPSVASNGDEPKWFWSGGLQFGAAQARLDYSKLFFADQIDRYGAIYPSVSAADPAVNGSRFYPDFAAGTFFHYRPSETQTLLIGFSAHHINRPDESLTATIVSPLPVKWTGNFLYSQANTNNTWAFTISGLYYQQAANKRYQMGFEATHNDYSNVSVGLYYGGSFKKGDINTVAFTVSLNLFGGEKNSGEKIRAGLAHDAQAGSQSYMRTGGSSELGIVWNHDTGGSAGPCKPKIGECPFLAQQP